MHHVQLHISALPHPSNNHQIIVSHPTIRSLQHQIYARHLEQQTQSYHYQAIALEAENYSPPSFGRARMSVRIIAPIYFEQIA